MFLVIKCHTILYYFIHKYLVSNSSFNNEQIIKYSYDDRRETEIDKM